jgi:hypothetical protein
MFSAIDSDMHEIKLEAASIMSARNLLGVGGRGDLE